MRLKMHLKHYYFRVAENGKENYTIEAKYVGHT